jgi:tetratricopeptide (TPR) repeat protein
VRGDIGEDDGICSIPATSIRATQEPHGFLGRLLQRFRKAEDARVWTLPSGEPAGQDGQPQNDLILVWTEAATFIDEAQIRARWPQVKAFQQLGKRLFLLSGVELPSVESKSAPGHVNPQQQAEQLLAAARKVGDRRQEASALADLGVTCLRQRDARRAVTLLEEALAIDRQLQDRSAEIDVLGNLGSAVLAVGESPRALELLDQALSFARAAGDRFQEKIALTNLGRAYSTLRNPNQAITFYAPALVLARHLGDRQHEADLLWYQAIEYAELGCRDPAIQLAQATIALLDGKPQTVDLATHLELYRSGDPAARLSLTSGSGPAERAGANSNGAFVVTAFSSQTGFSHAQEESATGPGLLRMAISAAKSMAKFLGSGCQTVSAATHKHRLDACAPCEHHTGVRCKICGCFTEMKAWLPHEECPIGKWPAV